MRIGRLYYPTLTLGYGKRFAIWTTGCPLKCKGCISPELQQLENGTEIDVKDILALIRQKKDEIDGVTISGGEPFFQIKELAELIRGIVDIGIDDILIYTGYEIEELKQIDAGCEIIDNVSCLVTGRYDEKLNDNKGLVGSSNQRLIVNRYTERYAAFKTEKRVLQAVSTDNTITLIGIPG